jgi:hypothetical protein
LRLHGLTGHRNLVKAAGVERGVVTQLNVVAVGFGIPPHGSWDALITDDDVRVGGCALEFAECLASNWFQNPGAKVLERDVIGRWVAGLEYPDCPTGVADDNSAVGHNDVFIAGIYGGRTRVIPDGFRCGLRH